MTTTIRTDRRNIPRWPRASQFRATTASTPAAVRASSGPVAVASNTIPSFRNARIAVPGGGSKWMLTTDGRASNSAARMASSSMNCDRR